MRNKTETIRKIVGFLNNPDEDGGFWLPNIQRPFVWSEEQICRLFDSILREYPISTLLVWKTTGDIRRRKFIDNWRTGLRLSDFYVPGDNRKKVLVLDGQQRLQALFIGLCGSFDGRELAFDILSGEVSAPDDVKYRFRFLQPSAIVFPWVKFKDLVVTTRRQRETRDALRDAAGRELTAAEVNKIDDHIALVLATFSSEAAITYQELDSIDNPTLYSEDDVVEVFIRANSGGTRLGRSDLLFSLLSATWDQADQRMEDLLESLNRHGFAFDRDFVLKTCLVLLGQAARYEVTKFRKPGVREEIEAQWPAISGAITDVLDFVRGKTFIQCDKALPTYLVLIPLVYLRYKYPAAWHAARDRDTYLLRCALSGAFTGQPDTVIDVLTRKMDDLNGWDIDEVFGAIRAAGRPLEVPEERFWQMGYSSDQIHLIFNWWYREFNHTPAYDNNLPQIDHIFPQSALRRVRDLNPETGRQDLMRYPTARRNLLANCMLLTREENGRGGKGDTMPTEWFAGKDEAYLTRHMIPRDTNLWELDRYEDFIAARMELMRANFRPLLITAAGQQ